MLNVVLHEPGDPGEHRKHRKNLRGSECKAAP